MKAKCQKPLLSPRWLFAHCRRNASYRVGDKDLCTPHARKASRELGLPMTKLEDLGSAGLPPP